MVIPVVQTHSHKVETKVWLFGSEESAKRKIKELFEKEKRDLEIEGLKEKYDFNAYVFNDGKLATIDNYKSSVYDETETITWAIGELMEG